MKTLPKVLYTKSKGYRNKCFNIRWVFQAPGNVYRLVSLICYRSVNFLFKKKYTYTNLFRLEVDIRLQHQTGVQKKNLTWCTWFITQKKTHDKSDIPPPFPPPIAFVLHQRVGAEREASQILRGFQLDP